MLYLHGVGAANADDANKQPTAVVHYFPGLFGPGRTGEKVAVAQNG
jgi:hypothetical protein